jgi:CelD/BcsL family acetyltransferase involved in cellulose biosynthesis
VDPTIESDTWELLLDNLGETLSEWDELQLDGVSPSLPAAWARRGQSVREEMLSNSRFTDLNRVRQTSGGSCLGLLVSRDRRKIRHTSRALQERFGPVTIDIASSAADAETFLSELKILHERRWSDDPSGGAFAPPFWERFHRHLIARHFDSGVIQLSRVRAGDHTLGLLYCFVHGGRVYAYQSGINYGAALPNESLGLLIHAMIIDYNAALGHEIYDLMAGDSQYKRALTTDSVELWWGALQSPRLSLAAERLLRRGYRALRARLRSAPKTRSQS